MRRVHVTGSSTETLLTSSPQRDFEEKRKTDVSSCLSSTARRPVATWVDLGTNSQCPHEFGCVDTNLWKILWFEAVLLLLAVIPW